MSQRLTISGNQINSGWENLTFPDGKKIVIDSNGINGGVGQISCVTPQRLSIGSSDIFAKNGARLFPSYYSVYEQTLNVTGSMLGVVSGPPTNVSASSNQVGRLDLQFTQPSNTGGSAIQSYIVVVYDASNTFIGGANVVVTPSTPSTLSFHTALNSGITYYFEVAAVNGTGYSTAVESNQVTVL